VKVLTKQLATATSRFGGTKTEVEILKDNCGGLQQNYDIAYNKGIYVVTKNYKSQIFILQGNIFSFRWRAALRKAEVPMDSPMFAEISPSNKAKMEFEKDTKVGMNKSAEKKCHLNCSPLS
jgi:hypothetical protein